MHLQLHLLCGLVYFQQLLQDSVEDLTQCYGWCPHTVHRIYYGNAPAQLQSLKPPPCVAFRSTRACTSAQTEALQIPNCTVTPKRILKGPLYPRQRRYGTVTQEILSQRWKRSPSSGQIKDSSAPCGDSCKCRVVFDIEKKRKKKIAFIVCTSEFAKYLFSDLLSSALDSSRLYPNYISLSAIRFLFSIFFALVIC